MKQKIILIIGFLIIISFTCYTDDTNAGVQAITNQKDLPKYCESVLDCYVKLNFHEAYTLLRELYPNSPSDLDAIELKFIQQWDVLKNRYGAPVDYKFIKMEEIKEAGLIQYLYVIRYEKAVMRYKFLFYKPTTNYLLISFTFDDKVVELFSS